ncbi:MAG TPA: toll/interleukin-1 receptor domain-containing protein [Ktedonobacterales bacterium]|jgi:hypothetical protein
MNAMNADEAAHAQDAGARLFISYRRADSASIAGRIYDRLAAYFGRAALFKDVDNIPIGANFEQVIASVVAQSAVVLVLVGPTWATIATEQGRRLDDPRDTVRIEVEAALRRGAPTIPVLVEGAALPDPDTLPPSLRPLFAGEALQVRNNPWFDGDMSQLATLVSQWLPLRATSLPDQPGSQRPASRRGRWFATPLGLIAVAVLIFAVALLGLTGVGLAGAGPFARLGASATPLATAPHQAAPTATPVEHVVFSASLAQAQSGWEVDSECAFQRDGYHVTAPAGEVAYCLSPSSYTNFHLQTRAHAAAIAAPVEFALVFRASDGNDFDYVTISLGGGQARWAVFSHNNGLGALLGSDLTAVGPAASNGDTLLEVYANGPLFRVLVNGTQLGDFQDANNTVGQIGLGVESGSAPATAIYTSITIATLAPEP